MGHELQPDHDPEELEHAAQQAEEEAAQSAGRGDNLIGQTLDGRYRFDELLGEGTFARVYRVHDLARQVDLAAKVLRSDIAQEPAFLERFKREATVLARLQHPNIVRYYDIVESGRHVFILTDYIKGDTLQWKLREQGGAITPFDSLQWLRPMAAALHFAHQEGVVHRDLKPANILIDDNNNVLVTDFGIAKILTDTSTLTVDMTVGTPHYMSPEQIMAADVTPAADIYALGVLLYQMYTGRLPFLGESAEASGTTTAVRIAYEHLHVAPTPPTRINRRLSVAVQDVILKCLEKDPHQRYASINAAYEALSAAIGTPSVALDAGVFAAGVTGDAERVPTDVGGLSRVGEALAGSSVDDLEDEDAFVADYDDYDEKPKRKAKREASRGESSDWEQVFGEKGGEKQAEKQADQDEKEREKGPEKAAVFDFGGSGDQLSWVTWGVAAIWLGLVWMMGFDQWLGWALTGTGALLMAEVAMRLVSPQFRARPGGRLVLGSVFFAGGVSMVFSTGFLWPLVVIAMGLSLLANRMVDE